MHFFKRLFGSKQDAVLDLLPTALDEQDAIGGRDALIKSKAFFQKQIEDALEDIDQNKNDLKDTKDEKGESFDFCGFFYDFNMDITNLITAKYSKGEPIEAIVPDCTPLMETTSRFWNKEIDYSDGGTINFIRLINSICIGILGGVDKKLFKELSAVMQEKRFSDLYIDLLIQSVLSEHPVGEKLYVDDDKGFNLFVEVLQEADKERAEQLLAAYLKNDYYTKDNLERLYNIHEYEGARLYYGYWCWEAAAVVKIKGLDDTLFKDNPYYPYDFAHYKP